MCRQDGPRPGSSNEDGVTVIKTMDLVISLGKEVRERDKSVMIPGFVAWEDRCLVVLFTHSGNTGGRPGLGTRVRRMMRSVSCGRFSLNAMGTPSR